MFYEKIVDKANNNKYKIFLNLENLNLTLTQNGNEDLINELLMFGEFTARPSKNRSKSEIWDNVFTPVNRFLKLLDDNDLFLYASTMLHMHYEIAIQLKSNDRVSPINSHDIIQLEQTLDSELLELDKKMDLCNRLIEFATESFPVNNGVQSGERPQDTNLKTIHHDEYIQLLALAVLCRLVFPIFTYFRSICEKRLDNQLIDYHCAAILRSTINEHWELLDTKLRTKIEGPISKLAHGRKKKLSNTYNAHTADIILETLYAIILTRRITSVNLYSEEDNLVTYIYNTSCSHAKSLGSGSSKEQAAAIILGPEDREIVEDDGNTSVLETESQTSTTTADYPIIIDLAIEDLNTFVEKYELDQENIEAAQEFYLLNPITVTPLNSFLLSIVFGNYICGARTVESMTNKNLAFVIPILQEFFINQGYDSLVDLVSLKQTSSIKPSYNEQDNILISTYESTDNYIECDKLFHDFQIGDIGWSTQIKNIVSNITQRYYLYNTAPVFYDELNNAKASDSTIVNGHRYITNPNIVDEICGVILAFYN